MKICIYGDPVLRGKTEDIEEIDSSIKELAHNMIDAMKQAKGIGLAGPQVGVLKKLVVVGIPIEGFEIGDGMSCLINPEAEFSGKKVSEEEGCLSFPGIYARIKRYSKGEITALNLKGEEITFTLEDIPARIIQHELDHLDGILFIDRMSRTKRSLISSDLKKLKALSKK